MIVRNKHQIAEIIRKGRKVDYIYKGGKRVFGIEPAERLFIKNPNLKANFPDYYNNITDIFFSNVFPANVLSSVDITYNNEFYKTYVCIISNGIGYSAVFCSKFLGVNTKMIGQGSWESAFSGIAVKELPLSNLDLTLATNVNHFAADCVQLETTEGISHFRFDNITEFINFIGHSWTSNTYENYHLKYFNVSWILPKNLTRFALFSYIHMPNLTYFYIPNLNLENCQYIMLWVGNLVCNGYFFIDKFKIFANTRLLWQRIYMHATFNTHLLDFSECYITQADINYDAFVTYWDGVWDVVKTPAFCYKELVLPTTYYNADGSVYGNKIPANTVGSVTIYRTPPTSL